MPVHVAIDHVASLAALEAESTDTGEHLLVTGVRSGSIMADAPGVDPDLLRANRFEARVGQTVIASTDHGLRLLAGLGETRDAGEMRKVGAAIAKAGSTTPHLVVDLTTMIDADHRLRGATALCEGLALGTYAFDRYKERSSDLELARITVLSPGGKTIAEGVRTGARTGEVIGLVRDLVNTPGGDLTPAAFAEKAQELATDDAFDVEVFGRAEIEEMGLGGLLGVNRGSFQEPRLLKIRHRPDAKRPKGRVALVGKGITFDSGGLSIKTAAGMEAMKTDMAGGAAVLGAMLLVPLAAPRMDVTAFIPLTDNMLGPDATRVGDVLHTRNGKTVEVLNTDAEGRLVLADALALAAEESPDAIIDLATLTGACMVALGDRTAGLMANHDVLADRVLEAGRAGSEDLWRLPMPEHLRAPLDSEVADLRNIGSGPYGGALTAAIFLREFVDDVPWAHLDIAGPSHSTSAGDEVTKGGTGFGVRTLVNLLADWSRLDS